MTFFQGITADIAAVLPDDPLEHMINAIESIQEKDRRRKGILTNENSTTDTQGTGDAANDKAKGITGAVSKTENATSESVIDKTKADDGNDVITKAEATNDAVNHIQDTPSEDIEDKTKYESSDDTKTVDDNQDKSSKDILNEVPAPTVGDIGEKTQDDTEETRNQLQEEARDTGDKTQDEIKEEAGDKSHEEIGDTRIQDEPEDTGDKIQSETENTGDKIQDEPKDTGDNIQSETENTGDIIQDETEEMSKSQDESEGETRDEAPFETGPDSNRAEPSDNPADYSNEEIIGTDDSYQDNSEHQADSVVVEPSEDMVESGQDNATDGTE